MGSKVQSTVGCFPELCFLQFSVAQVLVGFRKQFINFAVGPVLLVLKIIKAGKSLERNCTGIYNLLNIHT